MCFDGPEGSIKSHEVEGPSKHMRFSEGGNTNLVGSIKSHECRIVTYTYVRRYLLKFTKDADVVFFRKKCESFKKLQLLFKTLWTSPKINETLCT